jgi:hypothetical protein
MNRKKEMFLTTHHSLKISSSEYLFVKYVHGKQKNVETMPKFVVIMEF